MTEVTPTHMVVCTFTVGTDMAEVFAVRDAEHAAALELQAAGMLGTIRLALARGTVFLEVRAADEAGARAIVEQLPMARWWDLDVFPLGVPD
jgi:muconolactone delta-isomerase